MIAIIIIAAVLAWFGCGLLAVYLMVIFRGSPDNAIAPCLIAAGGLTGLLVVIVALVAERVIAGARRHGEGK